MIETTHTTFHGIVPGRKAYPIGKVTLPVTFGTPANFRTERIVFELVPFDSPYHCSSGGKSPAPATPSPLPWRRTAKRWTSWAATSPATLSSGSTGERLRRPTHSPASGQLDSRLPPAFSSTRLPSHQSPPRGRSTLGFHYNQRQPWSHSSTSQTTGPSPTSPTWKPAP